MEYLTIDIALLTYLTIPIAAWRQQKQDTRRRQQQFLGLDSTKIEIVRAHGVVIRKADKQDLATESRARSIAEVI